jgi:uncharacterized protein YcgI (DUF1989 family)
MRRRQTSISSVDTVDMASKWSVAAKNTLLRNIATHGKLEYKQEGSPMGTIGNKCWNEIHKAMKADGYTFKVDPMA